MSAIAHSVTTHAPYTARPGRGSLLRAVSAWFIGSNKTQLPKTMPTRVAPSRPAAPITPVVLQLTDNVAAELNRALQLSKTALRTTLYTKTSSTMLPRREQEIRHAASDASERDYPIV